MMNKLKKTAVLLAGAMIILVIVVWGIKHNMEPADSLPQPETETETVAEEPEATDETPDDYDIAANMKLKDKDGVKTLKTDHFTLTLTHGDSWDVRVNSKASITIYNKDLYKDKHGGKIVTILAYDIGDDSYDVLPEYNVIGESNGKMYIAAFPTDVQFDESNKESYADYMAVFDEASRIKSDDPDSPLVLKR